MSNCIVNKPRNAYLVIEFAVLYLCLPFALEYNLRTMRMPVIPVLLLATIMCLGLLLRDKTFDRTCFWRASALRSEYRRILSIFAVITALSTAVILCWSPQLFLNLPREYPVIWILIMLLYPLFSVYPQELVYRAFLFHRYEPIMPSPQIRILASALSFGLVHIVFGNMLAVTLTIFGGLLFAWTYHRSKSLAAVFLEHTLYGCCIFTLGLGGYFYHGTRWLAERIAHGG